MGDREELISKAIEIIRKRGYARGRDLAASIGVRSVCALLGPLVDQQKLVACAVMIPRRPNDVEYRLSAMYALETKNGYKKLDDSIMAIARTQREPVSARDLSEKLNIRRETLAHRLARLAQTGMLTQVGVKSRKLYVPKG